MSKLVKYYIVFNVVCLLVLVSVVAFIYSIAPSMAVNESVFGPARPTTFSPYKQFGGRITYAMPCIPTPPDGICKNCTVCAAMGGPYTCAAYMEVQFEPALGNQMIPPIVCPLIGHLYTGWLQTPRVGGQIMGWGLSPLGAMIYDVTLSL